MLSASDRRPKTALTETQMGHTTLNQIKGSNFTNSGMESKTLSDVQKAFLNPYSNSTKSQIKLKMPKVKGVKSIILRH
jgi:hypothetical protein